MMHLASYKATRPGLQGLYNRFVRLIDGGPYSHTELVFSNGWAASSSFLDGGVRFKRIEFDPAHWDFLPLDRFDEDYAWSWFLKHEDTRYDLLGQAHFLLPFVRPSRTRVWCSEAVAAALQLADPEQYGPNGLPRFLQQGAA